MRWCVIEQDKFEQWLKHLSAQERNDFWDHIFNEPFAEAFISNGSDSPQAVHINPPFPPVDVHERDHQLIVIMEVAGVNREQIELSAAGNRFMIKGRTSCPLSQTTIIQKERREGAFQREIELPRNIDNADYKATLRNGLLFIVFHFPE